MKYLFLAVLLVACSPNQRVPEIVHNYQVTCPVTMTQTVIDTVKGTSYYYETSGLVVYDFNKSFVVAEGRYPQTCVVKVLPQ